MFSKIEVNGDGACELYAWLREQTGGADIGWNFEKFLIGRDGTIKGRYKSGVGPDDAALKTAIEAELAKGG
jgi:glutathione peroxidase